MKTGRTKRVQKGIGFWKRFRFKQSNIKMANNHPVFIFLPLPFLFFLECTIPSCLFGNFNGSSGRPGDRMMFDFSLWRKNCACSSLPYHTFQRWVVVEDCTFEIFWVSCYSNWRWFGFFCLMVQLGWEPTSIVWGFGWRLWEYESDTMVRYNCEMNDLKVKT